jgi:hypothetical protein
MDWLVCAAASPSRHELAVLAGGRAGHEVQSPAATARQ